MTTPQRSASAPGLPFGSPMVHDAAAAGAPRGTTPGLSSISGAASSQAQPRGLSIDHLRAHMDAPSPASRPLASATATPSRAAAAPSPSSASQRPHTTYGPSERERQLSHEVDELRRAVLAASNHVAEAQRERRAAEGRAAALQAERDELAAGLGRLQEEASARWKQSEQRCDVLLERASEAERERDEARATVAAADTALTKMADDASALTARYKRAKSKGAEEKRLRLASEQRRASAEEEVMVLRTRVDRLDAFVAGPLRRFTSEAAAVASDATFGDSGRRSPALDGSQLGAWPRRRSFDAPDDGVSTQNGATPSEDESDHLGVRSFHGAGASDRGGWQRRNSQLSSGPSSGATTARGSPAGRAEQRSDTTNPYEVARTRIMALTA